MGKGGGLPDVRAGQQSQESPMAESIRAQWKNLPASFMGEEAQRREGPEGVCGGAGVQWG